MVLEIQCFMHVWQTLCKLCYIPAAQKRNLNHGQSILELKLEFGAFWDWGKCRHSKYYNTDFKSYILKM